MLAALLHAAALGGLSMREVHGWVSDPDAAQARIAGRCCGARRRRRSRPTSPSSSSTNSRTRTSITSTVMPALAWLAHPAAAAAAQPGPAGFDVAELLASRATVYLLGGEEAQAAPLVCALTGHIARQARALAALQPGGRLDPALTFALDEAALISPVPLQRWTADMGGRGVTIVAAFQSRAQLLARYGEADAAVILNNAAAALLFGGTRDRDDLQFWSTLAGERDEPVLSTDVHGSRATRTVRKVPVLAPAQLANLPGRAGGGVPARDAAGDRAGRAGPPPPRRPRRAHRPRALVGAAARPARPPSRPAPPAPTRPGARRRPVELDDDPWVIPPEWTATSGPTARRRRRPGRDGAVVLMAARDDTPSIREIAELTARLRALSDAGPEPTRPSGPRSWPTRTPCSPASTPPTTETPTPTPTPAPRRGRSRDAVARAHDAVTAAGRQRPVNESRTADRRPRRRVRPTTRGTTTDADSAVDDDGSEWSPMTDTPSSPGPPRDRRRGSGAGRPAAARAGHALAGWTDNAAATTTDADSAVEDDGSGWSR